MAFKPPAVETSPPGLFASGRSPLRSPSLRSPRTPALLRRSRRHQEASRLVDGFAARLAAAVKSLELVLHESAELGGTVESLTAVVGALQAAQSVATSADSALEASTARLLRLREKQARLVLAELVDVLQRGSSSAQAAQGALRHEPQLGALAERARGVATAAELFCRQLGEAVGGRDACAYTFDFSLGGVLRDGALPLMHAVATFVSEMLAARSGAIAAAADSIAERLDNPQRLSARMLVDAHLAHPFALGPRVLALLKRFGGTLGEGHADVQAIEVLLLTLREHEERETQRCAAEQAARQLDALQLGGAQPSDEPSTDRRSSWIPQIFGRRGSAGVGARRETPTAHPAVQPSSRQQRPDSENRAAPAAQLTPRSPAQSAHAHTVGSSAKRRLSASSQKRSEALRRHLGFGSGWSKGAATPTRASDVAAQLEAARHGVLQDRGQVVTVCALVSSSTLPPVGSAP